MHRVHKPAVRHLGKAATWGRPGWAYMSSLGGGWPCSAAGYATSQAAAAVACSVLLEALHHKAANEERGGHGSGAQGQSVTAGRGNGRGRR